MKYVFVDMDGTIAEWGYPDGRIGGEYRFGDYIGKQPINDVIAEIYNLFSNTEEYIVFVVSAVPNSKAIIEKNAWLNNFFVVPYENRIFILNGENKVEIINFYLRNVLGVEPQENAILIDDRRDWLMDAERNGYQVYHPTKLIGMFQNRMAEMQKQKTENNQDEEKENVESPEENVVEPTQDINPMVEESSEAQGEV